MSARPPRNRYVAIRVEGPRAFQRGEMAAAVRAAPGRMWLVEFDGTTGLVRTTNTEKEAAIEALRAIESVGGQPARVVTMGTSGTIRAATRKYLAPRRRPSRDSENKPFK